LGSNDTEGDDEEMEDDEEEREDPFYSPDDDDVEVVDPPPPPVVSASSSLRSPPFASVARMPSSAQSIIQRPTVSYCWTPPHLKTQYKDFVNLNHQFLAFLLPSGVAFDSASDIRLSMSVYAGVDYYLNLEIEWPDTFQKDDGKQFLSFLKQKTLKRKLQKFVDNKSMPEVEKARAKKDFESSWVLLEMAVKQEMIRMRNAKGTYTLRSQTTVKMDFPVERLTEDCWELIGDSKGVRMLVVDLEQATENEDSKQHCFDRKVEMIGVKTETD